MTHTPGPWTVNQRIIYAADAGRGYMPQIATINPKLGGSVADANASLIAAAPETAAERDRLRAINAELLELAIAFERYLADDSRSERRRQACMSAARAAIAKAKGAEQSRPAALWE